MLVLLILRVGSIYGESPVPTCTVSVTDIQLVGSLNSMKSCVCVDEYCVVQRYAGSYAAYPIQNKCHVAYNDAPTSRGVLWFDAVNRSVISDVTRYLGTLLDKFGLGPLFLFDLFSSSALSFPHSFTTRKIYFRCF